MRGSVEVEDLAGEWARTNAASVLDAYVQKTRDDEEIIVRRHATIAAEVNRRGGIPARVLAAYMAARNELQGRGEAVIAMWKRAEPKTGAAGSLPGFEVDSTAVNGLGMPALAGLDDDAPADGWVPATQIRVIPGRTATPAEEGGGLGVPPALIAVAALSILGVVLATGYAAKLVIEALKDTDVRRLYQEAQITQQKTFARALDAALTLVDRCAGGDNTRVPACWDSIIGRFPALAASIPVPRPPEGGSIFAGIGRIVFWGGLAVGGVVVYKNRREWFGRNKYGRSPTFGKPKKL